MTAATERRQPLPRPASSFEMKVIGLCLIAILSALAIAFLAFQWQDWESGRADLVSDEIELAQQIVPVAVAADQTHDPARLAIAGALANGSEHTVGAVWLPAAGGRVRLMAPQGVNDDARPSGRADPTQVFRSAFLEMHRPYFVGGRRVGELVLWGDLTEVNDRIARNNEIAMALALFATLVSGLLSGTLARRALRPLYVLDRGIEATRLDRDLKSRVEVSSNDEFGRLTRNFNALLADLQTYEERLQGSLADLTEARDSAEQASTLKSQFLANMSHEIRTPLNGVLGMAQVMAMGVLTQVQRQRLEVIEQSGAGLLSILNDILDLSKIEAGRLELEAAPFDLSDVATTSCDAFGPLAEAKGVAFFLEIEDTVQGVWLGDTVRVRQLFQNLISNALKFTSDGEVRTRISAIRGEGLAIVVRDTGIGVATDAIPKLFEKFVQGDSSTTRRYGGTGLGLTICHEIVELMGGSITVTSELGKGSTFEIRLPLPWLGDAASHTGAASTSEPSSDIPALSVLAADDNATNQLVIRTLLEAFGIHPTIVGDGLGAVEAWGAGNFDAILMDIQMPEMDGVAATRQIRRIEAERGLARTPIIAVTANAMRHQVAEYMAAGMDAHLAKPIVVESLHAVLTGLSAPTGSLARVA